MRAADEAAPPNLLDVEGGRVSHGEGHRHGLQVGEGERASVVGKRDQTRSARRLTSSAPDAGWGGFSLSSLSFFSDDSVRRDTLGMRPSVGESTMHQALPVPDCAARMDRAASMSSEF